MEEMIIKFVNTYGWQLALIACIGIFLLGVLKFFKVFDKIEKDKRKHVYTAVSAGLSILASAVYLLVLHKFEWSTFGVMASGMYGLNQAIYALYENLGIRAGLRKLGNIIISIVAKNQLEEKKFDITEESVKLG